MNVTDVRYSTVIVGLSCGTCGMPFGLPDDFHRSAKQDGRWFYCPNGHKIHYLESENAALRKRNDRLEAQITHAQDQRYAAERSVTALKGHLTRLRRRIANGVCPWCQRHFDRVEAHVRSKHPERVAKMQEAMQEAMHDPA